MSNIEQTLGISKVIAKYMTGTLDAEESQLLKDWLDENPAHGDMFQRITTPGQLTAALNTLEKIDAEEALKKVKSVLGASPEEISNTTAREIKYHRLWPRIIAVAAAVATMVFGLWLFKANQHPDQENTIVQNKMQDIAPGKQGATLSLSSGKVIQLSEHKKGVVIGAEKLRYDDRSVVEAGEIAANEMLTASTARGQTYQFTLPDGSRVWLNADSKIRFPSQFIGTERKIMLEGEGYFEVAHNAKQPFRVESKGQVVEDIGTAFNINAYRDEASVKTTLVEGLANVNGTTLKPNQQATLQGDVIQLKEVVAEDAAAWKDGKYRFENASLEEVMRQLARWYDIEVVYEGPVPERRFSGGIDRRSNLSTAIAILKNLNISFELKGRIITISNHS